MPRTSNKRERLLHAAQTLLHEQGYNQTTLADIAEASGVPLGNVYYYFKTKDDIATAVIENRRRQFAANYEAWDKQIDKPKDRLSALLAFARSIAEQVTDHGCPVGSLCQELNKDRSQLSDLSGSILADQLSWMETQFRLMGRDDARQQAQYLIAQLQGSILLANSLKNHEILVSQLESLESWLNSLD